MQVFIYSNGTVYLIFAHDQEHADRLMQEEIGDEDLDDWRCTPYGVPVPGAVYVVSA